MVSCHMCCRLLKVKLNRGKDFRPAFANIGGLRALTDVPFMASTASATADTESTIVKSMQLKKTAIITRQLDRANIY